MYVWQTFWPMPSVAVFRDDDVRISGCVGKPPLFDTVVQVGGGGVSRYADKPHTQSNIWNLDQIIICNINHLWLRHSQTGQTRSSVKEKTKRRRSGLCTNGYQEWMFRTKSKKKDSKPNSVKTRERQVFDSHTSEDCPRSSHQYSNNTE